RGLDAVLPGDDGATTIPDDLGGASCPPDRQRHEGGFCGLRIQTGERVDSVGEANPNVLFGHRLVVEAGGIVRRFGFASGSTTTAKMALYADDYGHPGALVAESLPILARIGASESDAAVPAQLQPGT